MVIFYSRSGIDEVQRAVRWRKWHARGITPIAEDGGEVGTVDALVGVDVGGGAVALGWINERSPLTRAITKSA